MEKDQIIEVACAIICMDEKFLVTQRSEKMALPLKWEFPGGKLHKNETAENCIEREIKEELNIKIKVVKRIRNSLFNYGGFSINLIPFIAEYVSGDIFLLEHKQFKWLNDNELTTLDWAEADIPVLNDFLNFKHAKRGDLRADYK